jgi:hypothetical protein
MATIASSGWKINLPIGVGRAGAHNGRRGTV